MQMNKKEFEASAKEAAEGIKTPQDLNEFSQMLKKITVEAALNAEMDEHLGYEKHAKMVMQIAVAAKPVSVSKRKMVSLSWTLLVTETVCLILSRLRKNNLDLPYYLPRLLSG